MAITFKTPSQVADEYLQTLRNLKPEVNVDQTDSDWWIRGQVVGGVVSGAYADQKKIADDAFPQSARREALERHLDTYFGSGFLPAQPSNGNLLVSGVLGSIIPVLTAFIHEPTGNQYQATEEVTLVAATGVVPVLSVDTGQSQNLLEGTELTVQSPPVGIDPVATVYEDNISDGRNEETEEEAAARLLNRIRFPAKGGTENDYRTWAAEADPSVANASVRRFINGLGTVGVYFTAGTTDIDEAIDNGQPIIRIPSDALVQTVLDYIEAQNPLTDCVTVLKPTEVQQDVTVTVRYRDGISGTTVLAGQTLTCQQLVEREINRALYKIPIGGRTTGASGYVLASEIEESIDSNLSTSPYQEGEIAQILSDRRVENLTASGVNRYMLASEIIIPGTITIQEF